ncbi:dTDP-4-dehydrorhamnose reductase [compost metagenome]
MVHISTDYVFDGEGELPWCETDIPVPLNSYGRSKLAGEQAIVAHCERYLILRTSWLHSPWRHNFIKIMLRLGAEREQLAVICDQIGAPTSAQMLAEMTLSAISQTLAKPELAGLYHVAASGETSWYNYAGFIFHEARQLGFELKIQSLRPVLSKDYPTSARRPLNSRLDTTQFRTTFGVELPHWQIGVRETLGLLAKERY